MPLKCFPINIQEKYYLKAKVTSTGFIYIQIKKGMYRLKQAAVLVYNNLIKNLKYDGYKPIPQTDSYWQHTKYPTIFCLYVDDFSVKK